MASSQLQVTLISAENLSSSSDLPMEERFATLQASLPARYSHLDSALPASLARRVVTQMVATARPVRSRLTVKSGRDSIALDVNLRQQKTASGFRLATVGAKEINFALEVDANECATLKFDMNYAGLEIRKALHLGHFWHALSGQEGSLYLTLLGPDEEEFDLARLPLPIDPSIKNAEEDRIRLLEALDEVGKATNAEFIYPSEIEDEDLENLNRILKVIRGGWIALSVTDFTTPMNSEGVQNVVDLVVQRGEVFDGLAVTASWERREICGTWVDLGPSVHHISKARLATSLSAMREWLVSKPDSDTSFDVSWVPADGSRVHVFYQNWPKPSPQAVREDIRVFEEQLGKSSDEFRTALEAGEPWAREIPDGDIWLTLLDAERYLGQNT